MCFLDRFAIQNIPKQLDECDFVADIGFLIDASNSIREDYLSELQFVKLVAARWVMLPPIIVGSYNNLADTQRGFNAYLTSI